MEVFYFLLFLIAFLYASVGHGGASGYLALMALYSVAPEQMKPTALLLNLFVSFTAFIQYFRNNYFKFDLFIHLALGSIPMAYIGGMISLQDQIYKRVLGVLLLFAIARFLFQNSKSNKATEIYNPPIALSIGGIIGLLSGMIGIGGGIILSPLLLLLNWTDQKQTAAISSAFIFMNSLAGLAGSISKGLHFTSEMGLYVFVAFLGGLLGSYFGAKKFNQNSIKYVLVFVLFIAVYKLVLTKA
jgi:uncharacterized membrane protein YfcA